MKTDQIREFLARVRWRNVAALLSVLLIVTAIVWVIAAPHMWTSCLILVGSAYPLAILSLESPL